MAQRGRQLDITPSEMMELRNQGYSNKDIANMLDISVMTVRRYIGNQDCPYGSLAAFEDKPKEKKPTVASAEPPIPPYEPKVTSARYAIGDVLEVEIDHCVEMMRIETNDGGAIDITYNQARELIQFLAWASDKVKPTEKEE